MNLSKKLSLTALTAGLAICASPAAHAIVPVTLDVANGTYTFEATDGHNQLNGSTVTFSGDSIASWDMLDNTAASQGYPASYDPYIPPLTSANSSFFDLITYNNGTGPDAFSFSIASPVGSSQTQGSVFWFEAQNNLNGYSALYDGFGGGTPPESIIPETFTDPQGIWIYDANLSVPDASNSITLLAGSVTALGACGSILRRRSSRN